MSEAEADWSNKKNFYIHASPAVPNCLAKLYRAHRIEITLKKRTQGKKETNHCSHTVKPDLRFPLLITGDRSANRKTNLNWIMNLSCSSTVQSGNSNEASYCSTEWLKHLKGYERPDSDSHLDIFCFTVWHRCGSMRLLSNAICGYIRIKDLFLEQSSGGT